MSKIDGGLRSLFHDKLRENAHWQAIETGGVALGVPDSNYCMGSVNGREGWVEFKLTSSWAVGLTPEQVSWHKTRYRRGGRTFIAVRRQHSGGPRKGQAVDELWLCRGCWVKELRDGGLKNNEIIWLGVWGGGPAAWDWAAVRAWLEN